VSANGAGDQANNGSFDPVTTQDLRTAAFVSFASNLVEGTAADPGNPTFGGINVFAKDLRTGEVALVSADASGNEGNASSFGPSLSASGRLVAFSSDASNLVPGDTNGTRDVFVKNLRTGEMTLVSADAAGTEGNGFSFIASLSDNGRFVAFGSDASNLVPDDGNGTSDVFVKDLRTGEVALASADASGNEGNGFSVEPSLSANGRFVAFQSFASNLAPGDTDADVDVFLKDLRTGETTLASADAEGNAGDGSSLAPSVSANGRLVAFQSFAANLVPGDTNDAADVFVKDLRTGAVTLVSAGAGGNPGDDSSYAPSVSDNGRYVVFESNASNLVPGDTNGTSDIFLRDLRTGALSLVSADRNGEEGDSNSGGADVTDAGAVVFGSGATNLVPGDTNGTFDIFLRPADPHPWA
jgi:Tol biopolymer transport system component